MLTGLLTVQPHIDNTNNWGRRPCSQDSTRAHLRAYYCRAHGFFLCWCGCRCAFRAPMSRKKWLSLLQTHTTFPSRVIVLPMCEVVPGPLDFPWDSHQLFLLVGHYASEPVSLLSPCPPPNTGELSSCCLLTLWLLVWSRKHGLIKEGSIGPCFLKRLRYFWTASRGASGRIFQVMGFTRTQVCHGDSDGSGK